LVQNSGSGDNLFSKQSAAYDGRKLMIRFEAGKGGYLIFMLPINIDPFKELDGIDKLIPKINIGYKYKFSKGFIHPSFGFALAKYNEGFSNYYDLMSAYF